MRKLPADRRRKWFGIGLLLLVAAGVVWHFSPGLPVLFGPSASASAKQAGYELFTHEWQPNDPLAHGDGVGPVFNAKSCVACHFQGGVGGGGGLAQNVHNFTILPSARDPQMRFGTIHAQSTTPAFQETFEFVRKQNPIIVGGTRTENHCSYTVPDVDPLKTDSVQTTALFGAGWIDRISSKAIVNARRKNLLSGMVKEFYLDFDTIGSGRARVLPDGRIGKFGWKAQFATLEEFVAAACSNEVGLGTPKMQQAKPLTNPNYPDAEPDLDRRQFRNLVAFVETLPKPVEVLPASTNERDLAIRGKENFSKIGCVVCHVPEIGGVKGVYSDFLLHSLDDGVPGGGPSYGPVVPGFPIPDELPKPNEWKTPALWGVADSAPYMHDGRAPSLVEAIQAHGGDAKSVREAYRKLPADDQKSIEAFLLTLKAPPDAIPAPQAATAKR